MNNIISIISDDKTVIALGLSVCVLVADETIASLFGGFPLNFEQLFEIFEQ